MVQKKTSISLSSFSQLGDSSSSIIRNSKHKKKGELINFSFEAETITFGKLIKITDLDEYKKFCAKIDIEGAEYELFDSLLNQLSKINAVFLVSVHPWLIHKKFKKGFYKKI